MTALSHQVGRSLYQCRLHLKGELINSIAEHIDLNAPPESTEVDEHEKDRTHDR